MTEQEKKMQQGADEIIQFINKVVGGIKLPQMQRPQRIVNHINISVTIQPPKKGWIRTQLAKLW